MMESSDPISPRSPAWSRTLVYHASLDALGPKTDVILSRLGYRMVTPAAFEALRRDGFPELEVDLRVVDERRFEEVAASEPGDSPIVLLTGTQGAPVDDPRIVGAVKRPAGLHDLYRLAQQVFEDVPRATPRVATQLRARCEAKGATFEGRVLSLSENGCLIRSPEAIRLGQMLQLELVLPRTESVELEAEATYQLLPDTGLVFSALDAASRQALGRFVTQTILA